MMTAHRARRRLGGMPLIFTLTGALLLSACSGSPEQASEATTSGEVGAAATSTLEDSDEASDDVLVVADSAPSENLDPIQNESGTTLPPLFPIFDRLIHQVPGTGELIPGLAESWEFVDEGLRLELRQGVTFHDGTAFNAESVKANLERAMTHESASNDVQTATSPIEDVVVEDEFTVLISRYPEQEHDINWALISDNLTQNIGMMVSPATFDDPNLDLSPIGAGPYRVTDFQANSSVEYEAFDDYWDPEAQGTSRLEFLLSGDEDARLNAVRSGEADVTFIPERLIEPAEDAGLEVNIKETTGVFQVWFSFGRNVLDDVRVRQAFNYGIDREAFVEATTFGIGTPTIQLFPPSNPAYNPDYPPEHYAHDPERAQALLAEAGHPDGVTLELLILNRPQYVQFGEVLKGMLEASNITLDLQVVEPSRFVMFREEEVDMIVGLRARPNPLDTLRLSFAEDASFNPSGTVFPEFQETIEQAATIPPGPERNSLLQKASGIATEQALNAPLFAAGRVWVAQPDCVEGFDPPLSDYHEFRDVAVTC